jgi:hypothetical protein
LVRQAIASRVSEVETLIGDEYVVPVDGQAGAELIEYNMVAPELVSERVTL